MPKLGKKDKKNLLIGAVVGLIAGSFIPDNLNPGVIIKGMLNRRGASTTTRTRV